MTPIQIGCARGGCLGARALVEEKVNERRGGERIGRIAIHAIKELDDLRHRVGRRQRHRRCDRVQVGRSALDETVGLPHRRGARTAKEACEAVHVAHRRAEESEHRAAGDRAVARAESGERWHGLVPVHRRRQVVIGIEAHAEHERIARTPAHRIGRRVAHKCPTAQVDGRRYGPPLIQGGVEPPTALWLPGRIAVAAVGHEPVAARKDARAATHGAFGRLGEQPSHVDEAELAAALAVVLRVEAHT